MAYYEQTKTRKWFVRFRIVEFGKLKQKKLSGFNTKRDAEKAYIEYINKIPSQKQTSKSNSELTFSSLYDRYLEYSKERVKPSTYFDMKANIDNHLIPYFGSMKLFKITKHDVLNWQTKLNKQNFSYNFKSNLRTLLSGIFKYSVLYFDLPINPVSQVEPFVNKEPKKEMMIWTVDEFKKFISVIDDKLYYTLFSFFYLTGCRKGEIYALTWDKINFITNEVIIDKSLTRKVKGCPYFITTTKTGENRTVLLPNNLVILLKNHYLAQNNPEMKDFVFGGKKPLADNTVARRLKVYSEKAEVPEIHLHCFRHSHASLLISTGQSIVSVAKRLGHASIEQTLNTYAHLMPNEQEKLLKDLNFKLS